MSLIIDNLSVSIDKKDILNKFSLTVAPGEIHAIMGPNGTGKSTLSKVLLGDKNYTVKEGNITFNEQSLLELTTDQRARLGIFLAYQHPSVLEGVTNAELLRTSKSAMLGSNVPLYDFITTLDNLVVDLKMNQEMVHRGVNLGFSGGEAKRNEILQMKMLEPKLIILDEIDSGLDVDSLKIVGENVTDYYLKHPDTAIIIITHYPRILEYIVPDYVHIMNQGQIKKTGPKELAFEVEKNGYDFVSSKASAIEEIKVHE